ncbi:MAG: hypothetical protein JW709_01545 [Sedimentisphaerales bacterium]|nr:hypothetical protein [Sedimentisphaerales bacterium]
MKSKSGCLRAVGLLLVLVYGTNLQGVTEINPAQTVQPLAPAVIQAQPVNERSLRLAQAYYDSIAAWGKVIEAKLEHVPGHNDWGYYGLGGHTENDVRPICYAVMVNAFLAEVQPPQERLTPAERNQARIHAIACLRYLTQAHVTGGGACVNGKAWGNAWQSALWCRAAGLGGWLLWDHLDDSLRQAVARMVVFEADRFIDKQPKSSEFRDTGAEENPWNALVISLACNMMPGHPHAQQWDKAAKIYLYNTFSVKADQENVTIGDDGKAIDKWVTTINAHPDFTVENHGLVHVGYLKVALGNLLENASAYQLAGKPTPKAVLHHADDAFAVLKKCMSWDGAAIYFGGNDWKIVHSQCTDVNIYAAMSRLAGDEVATALEDVALNTMSAIQREEHGFYNVRRDLEYGGFCATRLISAYWLHALVDRDCKPITPESLNQQLCQVTYLGTAPAIVQRTPAKFASFAWGPKRMALALPENGSWVVWPHYSSYLGYINDQDSSDKQAELTRIQPDVQKDCFSVTGALQRCEGKITQDFSFTSLPGDVTVYIERLRCADDFKLTTRETGVIGHEYELGKNTRMVYGRFGKATVRGIGGKETIHEWISDWFNVGDKIGYVIKRYPEGKNIIRYHDMAEGSGRVPKLQEWFSLVGNAEAKAIASEGEWACIVTFLNQASDATEAGVDGITFDISDDTAICRIKEETVRVDFRAGETDIR